jgi:hypothetical protein
MHARASTVFPLLFFAVPLFTNILYIYIYIYIYTFIYIYNILIHDQVGNHVFISAKVDGAPVMRAYTPASGDDELGYFDLVIKVCVCVCVCTLPQHSTQVLSYMK